MPRAAVFAKMTPEQLDRYRTYMRDYMRKRRAADPEFGQLNRERSRERMKLLRARRTESGGDSAD